MDGGTSVLEEKVPPFRRLARGEQLMLAISIAAGEMGSRIERILRVHESVLSHARYNALRILRGAGPEGLSCTEIADRLLLTPPDVTRLMDPLVRRGLVSRAPSPTDRRMVLQRLTARGRSLLAELDTALSAVYETIAEGVGPEAIDEVVRGCERLITVARRLSPDPSETPGADVSS